MADRLGLDAALADILLPALVGAMTFLAAMAAGGALAATGLAGQWQNGAGAALTIQVTNPDAPASSGRLTRLQTVLSILHDTRSAAGPHQLTSSEVDTLLEPWLGPDAAQLALPLPAVITATWSATAPPDALRTTLNAVAPGTLVETGSLWAARVLALTASIQACAAAVLAIVAMVAASVVAVATRAGLAAGRAAIEVIHGLGALDSDIAQRFAGRTFWLTACGGAAGALAALPVLLWLAARAVPFAGGAPPAGVPAALWITLPILPAAAALIGWGTAQLTVRGWLRRLG